MDVSRWRPEWFSREFKGSVILTDTHCQVETILMHSQKAWRQTNCPSRMHPHLKSIGLYLFTFFVWVAEH